MQSFVPTRPGPALTVDYPRRVDVYDEMSTLDGQIRPTWQSFVDWLSAQTPAEVTRRWEKAQELIHENGVTYNVYGDPQGMERPWSLSPLPVLIAADEWNALSRSLAQRAELYDALLGDLYGPQRALVDGGLPPDIVYANPGFLRAVHGGSVPRGSWLPFFATDLVRASDGKFQVIEDRTQAPSGAGYALENRIVISGVLPDIFRESNVERLASFFRSVRECLQWLSPHNRDNPRIVLLTPGPSNASFFEQAYLAQYLGLTLVNGGDLTVRDDRVFLKTLGGLQPVDVIMRRVNDDFCDPLELRPESLLGCPGLVQAARAGNVALANPIGSGLAQTPAILPYLPALCRLLLGEDLILPSVRTWWCGDPKALAEALSYGERLVVKPAFPENFEPPIFIAALSAAKREEALARIKADPSRYVAQEYVAPSTTPVIADGKVVPRTLVLRCYAVATHPDGHFVMPGGLARIAGTADANAVSMQLGARSKDIWVLSNERVDTFSLLPANREAVEISRGGGDLPSRAADNLYWLGRYAERGEAVARLARVIGARLSDVLSQGDLERADEFRALFAALKAQTEFLYSADIPQDSTQSLANAEAQLVAAVSDTECAGSLASVIRATLRAGRLVRDRISMDTWRVLATLGDELEYFGTARGPDRLSSLVLLLNEVVVTLAAFSGLAMDSMTRGQAFHFLDMGRRLERGVTLVTLLRATLNRASEREASILEAVLQIADSLMTYRRRYLAKLQVAPVVDLLLVDDTNPRSVIYQVRAITDHIRSLPLLPGAGARSPQLRLAVAALNALELAEIDPLCTPDGTGARPALEALLRNLGTLLPALSDSLSDSYLNHASVSRHLTQETHPIRGKGA